MAGAKAAIATPSVIRCRWLGDDRCEVMGRAICRKEQEMVASTTGAAATAADKGAGATLGATEGEGEDQEAVGAVQPGEDGEAGGQDGWVGAVEVVAPTRFRWLGEGVENGGFREDLTKGGASSLKKHL
ncbi:hypothetical protein BHE74_00040127 [Ensete ventricosum]|nr:hypothetical protein BHE74_00040127 [Ensete ventricosum]